MKPLVILTHRFLPEIIQRELKPFAELKIISTRRALLREISRAEAVICSFSDLVDEELLRRAPQLKVVSNVAVGVNNIDLNACHHRGITVCNTPDVLTRATAECALALLFACARRLPEGEKLCRSGQFQGWESDLLLGLELKGRKAVLVGRGRIGRETAKLFAAIGIQVSWITRQDTPSSIKKKLRQAQILSFHCPLTSQTHHWLDSRKLALLPKDCILINTSRGAVIDEKALIRSLKQRSLFAAGIDVFEHEPQIPLELRRLGNVVLLPHLGSATLKTRQDMVRLAVSGVVSVLSGKRPINAVRFRRS